MRDRAIIPATISVWVTWWEVIPSERMTERAIRNIPAPGTSGKMPGITKMVTGVFKILAKNCPQREMRHPDRKVATAMEN